MLVAFHIHTAHVANAVRVYVVMLGMLGFGLGTACEKRACAECHCGSEYERR